MFASLPCTSKMSICFFLVGEIDIGLICIWRYANTPCPTQLTNAFEESTRQMMTDYGFATPSTLNHVCRPAKSQALVPEVN